MEKNYPYKCVFHLKPFVLSIFFSIWDLGLIWTWESKWKLKRRRDMNQKWKSRYNQVRIQFRTSDQQMVECQEAPDPTPASRPAAPKPPASIPPMPLHC